MVPLSASLLVSACVSQLAGGRVVGNYTTRPRTNTSVATSVSAVTTSRGTSPTFRPSNTSTINVDGPGIDRPFPDGQLSCVAFPTGYGAVHVDYLNLGGWIGLQNVSIENGRVTSISTGVDGDICEDGMMCSYACPPGYQKSQWPAAQGSNGESVGGLQCKNRRLFLTNPALSSHLCIPGIGGVSVVNNAHAQVAICRTDYPGTESETIPLEVQPGASEPLTCPDAATYFRWRGKPTSAQYYLNPIDTTASQACRWGNPGMNVGNWAPINLGVGFSEGKIFLSIMQNAPTTNAPYQGMVEITGHLSAQCRYVGGRYCRDATDCNKSGCTVRSAEHPCRVGNSL